MTSYVVCLAVVKIHIKIEKRKKDELLEILESNKIKHKNDIEVDVFNSPFQFINRRNEITVTITSDI